MTETEEADRALSRTTNSANPSCSPTTMSATLTVIPGDPATSNFELSGPSLAAQLIVRLVGADDCPFQLVELKYWIHHELLQRFG